MINIIALSTVHLYAADYKYYEEEPQKENEALPVQPQMQSMINSQHILQQYYDLFLDPFEKLVLRGKNSEARQFAFQREKEVIKEINDRYDVNTALLRSEYRTMQHRQGLTDQEKFTANHFRRYVTDPQTLIKLYENNIKSLEEDYKARLERIAKLEKQEKESPPLKEVLFNRIQEDFSRLQKNYTNMMKKLESLSNSDNKELIDSIIQQLKVVLEIVTGAVKAPLEKDVENLKNETRNSLEKISEIQGSMDDIFSQDSRKSNPLLSILSSSFYYSPPLSILDDIQEWLKTGEKETLSPLYKSILTSLHESKDTFAKDTQTKVAEEKARIQFIQTHPQFFKIQPVPRHERLGIADLEPWHTDVPAIRLGDGVVVGVVDEFNTCEQTSRVLTRAINPYFQGRGCQLTINEDEKKSHGLHVAGIIVSDLFDKDNPDDIPLGVAPHAQFEMISFQDLTLGNQGERKLAMPVISAEKTTEPIRWTPDKMASVMSQLFKYNTVRIEENGETKEINLNNYMTNPIVTSTARILNWSMGTGALKRFSRGNIKFFDGISFLPVFISSIQRGKLWITIAHNDGVDLSSTDQHRFIKALAHCPETASHIIVATNLMEDGLTLNATSNVPGKDIALQQRTLSAPGTNITSTILKEQPEGSDFEVYSGTSMAAPHISGVAAVVLSNFPHLTAPQLSESILKSATPVIVREDGTPVALATTVEELEKEMASADSKQNKTKFYTMKGSEFTFEDVSRGRELYGMGRVNLDGALIYAKQHFTGSFTDDEDIL